MKLTAILTGIGLIFGKAWKIIKAATKLKALKKEIIEAYEESEKAYFCASVTLKKIRGYFKEDSEGGKKLTSKEVAEATRLLGELGAQLKKATKEVLEAKDEIKKVIDSIKKQG